jgi:DNA-binding HxlR family transcriptional regulator
LADLENKISRKTVPLEIRSAVETTLGCKWSLTILYLLDQGINRPGQIARSVDGLAPKVMNTCLAKLLEFHFVEKKSFPEIPPRVEYHITGHGRKFMRIYDVLEELSHDLSA